MLIHLSRYWWLLVLRGAAAVLFALLALLWPGATLAALVVLFGAYTLVDGLLALTLGFGGNRRGGGDRGWLVLHGVLGIAAGIVVFIWPVITAVVLLLMVASWSAVIAVTPDHRRDPAASRDRQRVISPWAERSRCWAASTCLLTRARVPLRSCGLSASTHFGFRVTLIAVRFRLRARRADPRVQLT